MAQSSGPLTQIQYPTNLPLSSSPNTAGLKARAGFAAKSPVHGRKPSNPGTPKGSLAYQKALGTHQGSSPEYMQQSLRQALKESNQNAPFEKETHLQNAPKNSKRKQKANNGSKQQQYSQNLRGGSPRGYLTPSNLKSQQQTTGKQTQNANMANGLGHKRSESNQVLNKAQQNQLHEKMLKNAMSKRPPLKTLPQQTNSQKALGSQGNSNNQKRQSSKTSIGFFEQPSSSGSNNIMMNSSSYEDSQPQISAMPFQTASQSVIYPNNHVHVNQPHHYHAPQAHSRQIVKQDSDNLPISEERHRLSGPNPGEFDQARTHLHNFQVRKNQPVVSRPMQPDESANHNNLAANQQLWDEAGSVGMKTFLQIPGKAKNTTNQDPSRMFNHPYGGRSSDIYSEESTRNQTRRQGDYSNSATAVSRVNRELIGSSSSLVKDGSDENQNHHMSLAQSFYSVLGSFVPGAGSKKSKETGGSASARNKQGQNFSTKAASTQELNKAMHQQSKKELSDNDKGNKRGRTNSNPYQFQETASVASGSVGDKSAMAENSNRLNTLTKFTSQNLNAFALPGRNAVTKNMAGYSTFSASRSPMKSRQFTRPAVQPQEDEIVESMNIVTVDMLPDEYQNHQYRQSQAQGMHIQEPKDSGCLGCTDCLADKCEENFDNEEVKHTPLVQQRPTTLRDQTVCSCSGCMASQTAYEPWNNSQGAAGAVAADQAQKPTRICLETVLSECEQIRLLLGLLKQPRSTQLMITEQKRILLDRIQTYCEDWWGASSQFHNLHSVFEQDGTTQGQSISLLIKQSQVVLCVAIGLIASLSIDIQSTYLERISLAQTFGLTRQILQDAHLIQMKLTSIILKKMDREERKTNEFAVKLSDRINSFMDEYRGNSQIMQALVDTAFGEASVMSNGSDNSTELEQLLRCLVDNQVELLERQCMDRVPNHSLHQQLYSNLYSKAIGGIFELNIAKDEIANEVRVIQESYNKVQTDATTEPEPYQTTASDNNDNIMMGQHLNSSNRRNLPPGVLHPPAIQATPQLPSSTASLTASDEKVLRKNPKSYFQGHLSEIGEEPINVLSTEQNIAPSVERDISRISSNQSASALQNLGFSIKEQSTEHQQRRADRTVSQVLNEDQNVLKDVSDSIRVDEVDEDEDGPPCDEGALLPASTKKYTLVLDLDETLIHSHVQYKKVFSTRAQQQEYFNELAHKFIDENSRQPTKEELENLALEMVFNIRPNAEEFLNAMAQEFELVIFTAGEQDYADEILNTLDQARSITHRLYRQHTVQAKDQQTGAVKHYIKDLASLGRNLDKVLIIDNIKENFCRQPRNGIQITTWKDDPYDTQLMYHQNLLLTMARQNPADVRINLDNFKMHGLLPTHFQEPAYDESSSLQHFEPVVVANASVNEEEKKELSFVTAEGQEPKCHQDLTVSLDESYNNKAGKDSSLRRKSITNSAYQRRRLSAESVKQGEQHRNEPFPEGELLQQEPVIADAECFFVDDVPVRVDISDNDTPYGLMEGKISEENSKEGTTTIVNKNSAFVERQSTEENK